MSFNFSDQTPTETVMYELPTNPSMGSLQCVYAGRSNKVYTNSVAKYAAKTGLTRKAQDGVTPDVLDASLDIDRKMFPGAVVTGWEGIKDSEGNLVDYSDKECRDMLSSMPQWLMSKLSVFVADPKNFMPDTTPSDQEIEEQAGE